MYSADIIIYEDGKPIHSITRIGKYKHRFELESEMKHIASLFESGDLDFDDDESTCTCGLKACEECGYCEQCGCICATYPTVEA